jgi:Lon-like ATP-dependent protease
MIRVLTHLRQRSSFLALPSSSSSFGTSTLPSASWSPPGRLRTFFRDSKEGGPGGSKKFVTSVTTPAKVAFGEESPRYPHLQALPLVSRPIFPGLVTSITLTDEATIDALENLHKNSTSTPAYISCFLRRKDPTGVSEGGVIMHSPEVITDTSDLYETGTFVQIQRLTRATPKVLHPDVRDGVEGHHPVIGDKEDPDHHNPTATLILLAHRRVDLVSVDQIGPPIDVTVSHWPRMDNKQQDDTIRALSQEIISTIREVAQVNQLFRENLQFFPFRVDANDPYRLADFAASISAAGSPEDLQAVLEEKDAELRLNKALVLLNREREVSKLQQEISQKVEEKMSEAQRKYFLTEQLKSIKKELGMERDDKEALIEKYRKQLSEYPEIPEEATEVIEAELEKFSTLEKNSPEYQVTRSYLDWLTAIPWSVVTDDNFDIQKARKVLDRDHYGLDDVKDTILQFIAIGKLKGSVEGKILCLAGPPGVGKTSIASSIADALGRKFFRFSVGGLSDVSEIKGHRRTYIGAMPGKVIQCLKSTGSINPVILIDEIDKLGSGFRGDPASALLEVLDPSQNSSFRDHFLDVPVDISKCLFICTANDLDRISAPLLDRMEVIRLSGYDVPEKVAIAEQYLVPKSMRDSGLMVERKKKVVDVEENKSKDEATEATESSPHEEEKEDDAGTPLDKYVHAEGVPESLRLTADAINDLVRWYAREAGVRNLAKYIDKITRKLALQVVAEGENAPLTEKSSRKGDTWQVSTDNLHEYVGKKIFTSDRMYEDGPLPNGIVMGLAYTSMGGSALYIETQGIKRARLDSEGKPRGGGAIKVTGQLGDVMKVRKLLPSRCVVWFYFLSHVVDFLSRCHYRRVPR